MDGEFFFSFHTPCLCTVVSGIHRYNTYIYIQRGPGNPRVNRRWWSRSAVSSRSSGRKERSRKKINDVKEEGIGREKKD